MNAKVVPSSALTMSRALMGISQVHLQYCPVLCSQVVKLVVIYWNNNFDYNRPIIILRAVYSYIRVSNLGSCASDFTH
jgi:hypothetical protein